MPLKIIHSPRGLFSPLRLPDTPACMLYRLIQNSYLVLAGPEPLFTLLGTVAANMTAGDVAWLLFIGPSSCGKSELLKSLMKIENVHFKSSITGEQAYISATPRDKRAPGAKGGILYQLGQDCHAMIVLDDLTRRFGPNMGREDNKLLAIERDIHTGDVWRDAGSDGGVGFAWQGKIGMAAGCTPVIDRYHEISGQLGERWIYYRWPKGDDAAKTRFRLGKRPPGWQSEFRDLINQFFSTWVNLKFGSPPPRELTVNEQNHITDIAGLAARCRSVVERDTYHKDEITGWVDGTAEGSSRIGVSLRALFLGMDSVGVPEDYCWKIVQKCALDSMPAVRQGIIRAAYEKPEGVTIAELEYIGRVHEKTIERAYHDLTYHDVVLRNSRQGIPTKVKLTDDVRECLDKSFKELLKAD